MSDKSFAEVAFAALTEAKKLFGEYSYHDQGAEAVMDTDELVDLLVKLELEEARTQLIKLSTMDDTYSLVSSLLAGIDQDPRLEVLIDDEILAEFY